MLPGKLTVRSVAHSLSALVDSGAERNFIDSSLASKLNIEVKLLPDPLHVSALSGQCLPDITHVTEPLSLTLSCNHTEKLCFFVFLAPLTPLVLGHSWLLQHNPQIDWRRERVMGWSAECHMNCLKSATPPITSLSPSKPSKPPDLSAIPPVYHDLAAVFSKDEARSLSEEAKSASPPPRAKVITQGNLKPDLVKVWAVLDWPQLPNCCQLQHSPGFCQFLPPVH